MRVITAQQPAINQSADKIFVGENVVVVLDGASAFNPVPVPADTYADLLGQHLLGTLNGRSDASLITALSAAIQFTSARLDLRAGQSPSSTVSILRHNGDHIDLLILGDSVIVLPDEVLSDDRIDQLGLEARQQYRDRLVTGYGYDDKHRQLLRDLQTEQAKRRNVSGGYWIAEAVPEAADNAYTLCRSAKDVPWAVLATDGAYNPMVHLGLDNWEQVAYSDEESLAMLLNKCTVWEREIDPNAQELPRAKRHDDKAIAVVRF